MNILYIAEDYTLSKVHHNLVQSLMDSGHVNHLTVFCVSRNQNDIRIDSYFGPIKYDFLEYKFDGNLKLYKYNFFYKIKKKFDYLINHIDVKKFDIVIAATLFSEGAIAYKIFKKYKIPYIIAIRNTDINLYLKRMPHLWILGYRILKSSKSIVFISSTLKNQFLNIWHLKHLTGQLESKYNVITNGVDSIWLDSIRSKQSVVKCYKFLYIGNFTPNKNVLRLLRAFINLQNNGYSLKLTLIGGGGSDEASILKLCEKYPSIFNYKGKIFDKEKLREIIREHDAFIMVSHFETFGLVYIEALSQGLPVVYTKGQGIDGLFTENIGIGVDSKNIGDIENGIMYIVQNYDTLSDVSASTTRFSWQTASKSYLKILESILTTKN